MPVASSHWSSSDASPAVVCPSGRYPASIPLAGEMGISTRTFSMTVSLPSMTKLRAARGLRTARSSFVGDLSGRSSSVNSASGM